MNCRGKGSVVFLVLVAFASSGRGGYTPAPRTKVVSPGQTMPFGLHGTNVYVTRTILAGGTVADVTEFPWLAMLFYENKKFFTYNCAGSLVSNTFVLTAAHCVKGPEYDIAGPLKMVRLGEFDVLSEPDCMVSSRNKIICSPGKFDTIPRSIRVHPSYRVGDSNHRHDIALIQLASSPPLSRFLRPINLPSGNSRQDRLSTGSNLTVTGWSRTELFVQQMGVTASSSAKMKVDLPYVDLKVCGNTYRSQSMQLAAGQLCAGGRGGKNACGGHSGSPLMYVDNRKTVTLLGVVSYEVDECGIEGFPGIYTDVRYYLGWIRQNMAPPTRRPGQNQAPFRPSSL
ncbi:CLIP domain-containing serine protease B8-like [Wyeomyia smithii]|uniref:CLIP domain-containing serine protease B8-like n=1 Tax=Wyeomyia smithii TaxID=174621 RepID=UPI002467B150|nr:CLIP domain-containing serine protease B8-like [Wyeomyia smithii]